MIKKAPARDVSVAPRSNSAASGAARSVGDPLRAEASYAGTHDAQEPYVKSQTNTHTHTRINVNKIATYLQTCV